MTWPLYSIWEKAVPQFYQSNIEDYIRWYIIALTMDSNYEWIENKYEPGLFTFYMQEESLCPINKKKQRMTDCDDINKRKFRSEIKIPEKYRWNHRYNYFNTTINHQKVKSLEKDRRGVHTFRKYDKNQMKTQRLFVQNTTQEKFMSTREEGFMSTLKSTNINKYFHYDINQQRAKMFIYRGQPSNFIKRLSKKLHKNPQANEKSTPTARSNKFRLKTEYPLTDNSKQSINSDVNTIKNSKERLNFLEFLLQRNRQKQVQKSDSNKKRIQMTLTKLTQFSPPKMLQISDKFATQS